MRRLWYVCIHIPFTHPRSHLRTGELLLTLLSIEETRRGTFSSWILNPMASTVAWEVGCSVVGKLANERAGRKTRRFVTRLGSSSQRLGRTRVYSPRGRGKSPDIFGRFGALG